SLPPTCHAVSRHASRRGRPRHAALSPQAQACKKCEVLRAERRRGARREKRMVRLKCVALVVSCIVCVANAGSLRVGPTMVVLDAKPPVAPGRVPKNNEMAMPYETTVLRWAQRDNDDVYEPENDVIATPPIFELKPGETQILRVGMLQPVDAPAEVALRLY